MATRADPLTVSSSSPIAQYLSNASGEDERPVKRQKVAAACDQCREKKIKCDGLKPVCRPCQKRFGAGAICEWGERKTRSIGASKLEIIRLQSRIDELERANRRKSLPGTKDAPRAATPHSNSDQDNHSSGNAMMGLIEEGEHAESVVGDSSAASFMNRIRAVLDHQVSPGSAVHPPQSSSSNVTATALLKQRRFKNPDYVLPSRHHADKLLDIYWRLGHTLYPFIDREDFMGKYNSLWTGNPTMDDEICFICLLNAMFAVGCILDSTIRPQDRVECGEVYYKRAQGYVDLVFLKFQSVHTVQCLLLLAQYLQSTREPQQCWLFVGMAIRIAQSLGLDLPSTTRSGVAEKYSVQFLRKVWHGCVLMDRILAMTFGRPAIITSQAAASVPLPLSHETSAACTCSREVAAFNSLSPDLHFFTETLKLYEIMGETLSALYSHSPPTVEGSSSSPLTSGYNAYFGSQGARAAGTVLEIDSKYATWLHSLPLHLREDVAARQAQHMTHGRQRTVLSLRYAHIRTLLFRPVLSRFSSICYDEANPADKDSLAYKLALQCSVICVQSALHTIHLFGKIHNSVRLELLDDLLPSWWYCILYLYTAATVLVAARLNSSILVELGDEEVVLEASKTVAECLTRYGAFGKHAQRCAAAVALLFEQIPHRSNGKNGLANTEHTATEANSAMAVQKPTGSANSQDWIYRQPGTHAGPLSSRSMTQNISYNVERGQIPGPSMIDDPFFDPAAISFDLDLGGDMSWLSSIPFELYSETG
jgi:hypothetical protein